MKTKYLLLVGMVVVLASCSSAYRNGQTPDDVYYSPVPASESYVVKKNSKDRNTYRDNSDGYSYTQEREIRQGIQNARYRYGVSSSMGFSNYNFYGYNPFSFSPNPYAFKTYGYNPWGYSSFGYNTYYGNGFNNSFGYYPYHGFNPYYASYGYNLGYGKYYPPANYYPMPRETSTNRGARMYNLDSYTPPRPSTAPRGVTTPTKTGVFRSAPIAPVRTFESRTTPVRKEKSGLGSEIRRVFTPSDKKNYTPPANNRRTERSNTPPVRRFDPPVRSTQPPVRSNNNPPVRNSTPPVRSTNNPPVRNNTPPVRSTNNPPVRTFDPSPAVSTPAPSASSSSTPARESSSTPVRTFKNN